MKKIKEYIVYDDRTDDVLAVGTAQECTRQMGWKKVDTFHQQMYWQKKRAEGKIKGNRYISIYEIEEDENE